MSMNERILLSRQVMNLTLETHDRHKNIDFYIICHEKEGCAAYRATPKCINVEVEVPFQITAVMTLVEAQGEL